MLLQSCLQKICECVVAGSCVFYLFFQLSVYISPCVYYSNPCVETGLTRMAMSHLMSFLALHTKEYLLEHLSVRRFTVISV